MDGSSLPYLHIENALSEADIAELVAACKQQLQSRQIPCYALLDRLDLPAFVKIKGIVEREVGRTLFYLNDFYIYTDRSFKTEWHIDTELFTFDRAINAWILLSPSQVDDPLGFIGAINVGVEEQFHKVRFQDDTYVFEDYFFGKETRRSAADIEAGLIHTPQIRVGDVLIFDPRRFHRTMVDLAKHAISIKFVMPGSAGFLSPVQVDSFFWPEVGLFNKLVKAAKDWDQVIAGIRACLQDEEGRGKLSSGFYPEKFDLYTKMIASL